MNKVREVPTTVFKTENFDLELTRFPLPLFFRLSSVCGSSSSLALVVTLALSVLLPLAICCLGAFQLLFLLSFSHQMN